MMSSMLKKSLMIGGLVVILGSGGAYIHQVNKFDENAKVFIDSLDKLKPYAKFDKVEIHKYAFKVVLSGFEASTKALPEEFQKEIKELTLKSPDTTTICYNPLTKTLSFKSPSSGTLFISYGDTKKELQTKTENDFTGLSLTLKDSLNLKDFDLVKFLTGITKLSKHIPAMTFTDAQTKKVLLSCDKVFSELSLSYPEDNSKDMSLGYKDDYKNLKLEPEFFSMVFDFVQDPAKQAEMKHNIEQVFPLLFRALGPQSGWTDFKFKINKGKILDLIDSIKIFIGTKQWKTNLTEVPSLDIAYKGERDESYYKGPFSFSVQYDETSKQLSLDSDMKATFTPKAQEIFATIFEIAFKGESQKNPDWPRDAQGNLFIPTLKEIEGVLPDLSSLGELSLDMKIRGNILHHDGTIDFNLGSNQYGGHVIANYTEQSGGKVIVELRNHADFFKDLEGYVQRVATSEIPKKLGQDITSQIPMAIQGINMAKATVEAMGKTEQKGGKSVLSIEIPIPGGVLPQIIAKKQQGAI